MILTFLVHVDVFNNELNFLPHKIPFYLLLNSMKLHINIQCSYLLSHDYVKIKVLFSNVSRNCLKGGRCWRKRCDAIFVKLVTKMMWCPCGHLVCLILSNIVEIILTQCHAESESLVESSRQCLTEIFPDPELCRTRSAPRWESKQAKAWSLFITDQLHSVAEEKILFTVQETICWDPDVADVNIHFI